MKIHSFKIKKHGSPKKEKRTVKLMNSIFAKLTLYFTAIIMSILLIVAFITTTITNIQVKEQFIASSREVLHQNKNYIELIVDMIENYAMQIYSSSTIQKQLSTENDDTLERSQAIQEISKRLREILGTSDIFNSIHVVSKTGMQIGVPTIKKELDYKYIQAQSYYEEVVELGGRSYWTQPYLYQSTTSDTEKLIISNIRVLKDMIMNEEVGVLLFNIPVYNLQRAIMNDTQNQDTSLGYTYIVDDEGYILVHPKDEFIGKNVNELGDISAIMKESENQFTYIDQNDLKEWFAVFATSDINGWKYVSVIPAKELTSGASQIKSAIILVSILCLGLTLFLTMILSFWITNPLKHMILEMEKVKKGNLKVQVNCKTKDEIGALANSFNIMIQNVKDVVTGVKRSIDDTSITAYAVNESGARLLETSDNVSIAIREITQGALEQAEQATEIVTIVNNFGNKIDAVTEYINDVRTATIEANGVVDSGMRMVSSLKVKSEESMKTVHEVTEVVQILAHSTKKIEGILDSITEIAEQTNLLSLNASIEAARAGQAGRGFAVVASEIGKIAKQSKKSVEEINVIIKHISKQSDQSLLMTDVIIEALQQQMCKVEDTFEAFNSISNSIRTVDLKVIDLNSSMDATKQSKREMINLIDASASISEEIAATTEQVSSVSENQAEEARHLNEKAEALKHTSYQLEKLINVFELE